MAKYYIKESEIRNYVRSLIREMALKKVRMDGTEIPNALNSDGTFDMDNCPIKDVERWRQAVKDFFNKKGLKPPRKPKQRENTIAPHRIIDFNTGDLVNSDEINSYVARNKSLAARDNASNEAQRYRNRKLDNSEDSADIKNMMNNVSSEEGDSYAEKWLNMSDDEREAARNEIINMRKAKSLAKNAELRKNLSKVSPLRRSNAEELRQEISDLKAKQSALGYHNDINDSKWKEYDRLIKDREKILNRFFGGVNSTDLSDETTDELVKQGLADDLSSAEEFQDTNVSDVPTNVDTPFEDEPIDYEEDNRNKKERDWGALKDMGFFDDEDY